MTIKANFPAIKPSLNLDFANSKVLDPRITFSRGSTATYYDGKTFAKAEENLLSSSNLSTGYATINATLTNNAAVAPDGTTTATKTVPTTANDRHISFKDGGIITLYSGQTVTYSAYFKPAGYNYAALSLSSAGAGANKTVVFDITSGVGQILTDDAGLFSSMTFACTQPDANGWCRASVTAVASTSFNLGVHLSACSSLIPSSGPSFAGDGVSGIYVWGMQLEQRSALTALTQTTTAPITNYIPTLQTAAANVARFGHDPVTGESKGLLIEEQRTNLLTNSALVYNTINTNVVQDTIAPDGTVSGCSIIATAANTTAYASRGGISFTSGTAYTFSIYVKRPAATPYVYLTSNSPVVIPFAVIFNIDTVAVESGSGSISSVGNGWYRLSGTATCGTTGTQTVYVVPVIDGVTQNPTNFKYPTYIGQVMIQQWGVQLEAGSFPTSYIPTTTAQVTRSADAASMTGSSFTSWYTQGEGSYLLEFSAIGVSLADRIHCTLTSGNNDVFDSISSRNYNSSFVTAIYYGSTIQASAGTYALTPQSKLKTAVGFKNNDCIGATQGVLSVQDSNVQLPNISALKFPSLGCNHISRFTYYPKRLSNTQLQSLTS